MQSEVSTSWNPQGQSRPDRDCFTYLPNSWPVCRQYLTCHSRSIPEQLADVSRWNLQLILVTLKNSCNVSSVNAEFLHVIVLAYALVNGILHVVSLCCTKMRHIPIHNTIFFYDTSSPVMYAKLISRKGAVYNTTKYI